MRSEREKYDVSLWRKAVRVASMHLSEKKNENPADNRCTRLATFLSDSHAVSTQWRSAGWGPGGGKGEGRGGRPEPHLSKGRHIEVSKHFSLSFSVQKKR